MRIARLDLTAFGSFSQTSLVFDRKAGAIELVYGPNEAGKSTTLRAISGLLFGIPDRTRDAYRYLPSELRVGGVLEARDGRRLEIVRRKGRKATLRDADDNPIDEALLSSMLGGATPELFESLFGLTHDGLRASAEALLAGRGHVGESLFSASVGGRGVHELRVRLNREADELFVARARERKVNKSISLLKEARDAVRNSATSPAKYLEQERAFEEAEARAAELSEKRTALVAEQAQLRRVINVLPNLRRRADLLGRLVALGEPVSLPPDAAERRRRAAEDLGVASREARRAAESESSLEKEIAALVVHGALASVDASIAKDLADRRGGYLRAEADRPKLEAKALAIEASVAKSLERIGVSAGAAELRVSIQHGARIRGLANREERVDERFGAARRALVEATARRDEIVTQLTASSLCDERGVVRAALEKAAELPVPTLETVDRFAGEYDRLESERTRIARERARIAQRRRDAERRLDELRRSGDVPTEADLEESRSERDALWGRVRASFGGMATESGRDAPALVGEFESAVEKADAVADRLRREAARVAERAGLEAELRVSAEDESEIAEEERRLEVAARSLDARWNSEWSSLRLVPRLPGEMRAWVRHFNALLEIDRDIAAFAAQIAEAETELRGLKADWANAVSALGLRPDCTRDEAFAVLDATTELFRQLDEAERLRGRIEGIRRDSALFSADVVALCQKYLPEAAELPPAIAAERLLSSFDKAQSDRLLRQRLEAELVDVRKERASSADKRADAEARLQSLYEAAGATDLEALEQAEKRAEEQAILREQLRAVEEQLVLAGDGASLAVLEEEARGADLDQARARLRDIERNVEELSEAIDESKEDVWRRKGGMDKMEHTDAAEASAWLEDRVAALKRHVHRYVRVRLAASILDREIERYRRENQGPVLSRAAELFPRLTLRRYEGLRAGFDDDGEAVLECLRADGTEVRVEALSEATRDGLYLALRLASLERYAGANEPMPLVLDDVLIQFDDDRARAALAVLGDVARTTQVLFFTHHARLVELARSAVGAERLSEHVLPAPSGVVPLRESVGT